MKITVNKDYLVFLGFFYFFLFRDFLERYVAIFGYADELVALLAIVCIALSRTRILKHQCFRYLYPICAFIIIGLISSIYYNYQPMFTCMLPDLFLNIKFWLSIIAGYYFFRKFSLKKYGQKIYFHIKLMTCLYLCLFILDNLIGCFDSTIRYGLRSTQLFYSHPTVFSACCVLLIGILFSIRDYVRGCDKYFFILLILMCSTLRSKAIGAALLFLVFYYIAYKRKKKIRLRTMLLFAPAVIAISWDQINYYFFSSLQNDSARYQLLIKAIQVANEHFPLGAGFGTYGSYFSIVHYSPLYYKYNLSGVHGLRYGAANFASDNFWPMILGETGWIGLLLIICALAILFFAIQGLHKVSRSYNFSAMCMFMYLIIASIAEAAFVHPVAIPIAIWLGVLFSRQKDSDIEGSLNAR